MELVKTQLAAKLALVCLCSLFSAPALANDTRAEPDNTTRNRGDHEANAVTADQAKDNKSDRDIMQKIRRSVVADDSLSTYAHNVKIIATNGKVTLKGPVGNAAERQTIEAKASDIAGKGNVANELTIEGQTQNRDLSRTTQQEE